MKSTVLDGFAVNPGDLSWDFLSSFGDYTVFDSTEPDEVCERLKDTDIVLTNRVRITEEVLSRCQSIKFVTSLGTGYDMIDASACRKRGITVCNVPGYSTDSVAQWAFTLLIHLTTELDGFTDIVRSGNWTGMNGVLYQNIKFSELASKTVGVYGCGAIGKRFGALCSAFSMKVLGYRRSLSGQTIDGIEYVSEERLLSESDIVSFHCPLTEETRGLVDEKFISRMKRGAYIINTSRGAVIDENALYSALSSGYLSGAGLDVMVKEPPSRDNPLLTLKNCIITPHCAWVTREARTRLLQIIEKNICSFIENGRGINEIFG